MGAVGDGGHEVLALQRHNGEMPPC
jgi:hypothetical protein